MTKIEGRRAVLDFAPVDIAREDLGGGAFVLRSRQKLESYPDSLCHYLEQWADRAGSRTFLAERNGDGSWRKLSYADMRDKARAVAAALLARGLGGDDPVMILSENSIEFAILQLGAMYAGVPVAPVSPAYSLMSQDFAKLKYIHGLLAPKLVFAADGKMYERAFDVLDLSGMEVVVARNAPDGMKTTSFDELTSAIPGHQVDKAFGRITPDTTAKILFTSGSTGQPKGVINTQRMLVSNQQTIAQIWRFLEARPPVIVDWLPWHHTFGGNHNFNMMLRNGGTLYIDNGKPVPGLIEKTAANLKEIAPTIYFNVPRGYDMLIPFLENDKALRDNFFSELDMIFYAAAALPQNLWVRLERLSLEARGEKVVMTSSWGATETSPLITAVHFPIDRAGVIGVPAPGNELKMVPNAGKLEMRVRGPNIMPGYYKQEELTRAAFDEDGFYKIGDAGKLADADNANKGVLFDGRVAEDFKLMTGTWVNVGKLRVAALAAGAPVIQDAVVTGHDRDEIGLLVFPNPAGCAQVAGMAPDTPLAELVKSDAVREALKKGLAEYNKDNPASSERIVRALLMTAPPSIDADEITDKGYINQRAVLESRADLVEKLYSDDAEVIVV